MPAVWHSTFSLFDSCSEAVGSCCLLALELTICVLFATRSEAGDFPKPPLVRPEVRFHNASKEQTSAGVSNRLLASRVRKCKALRFPRQPRFVAPHQPSSQALTADESYPKRFVCFPWIELAPIFNGSCQRLSNISPHLNVGRKIFMCGMMSSRST